MSENDQKNTAIPAKKTSAGLLMYRTKEGTNGPTVEVLLVHPGGPYNANKDVGCWDVPKGELDPGEDMLEAAKREFKEETGFGAAEIAHDFIPLGKAERPGKTVHVWAFQGECEPAALVSNTCEIEWPPRSGTKLTIPEVDRAGFFSIGEAKLKVWPYLVPIIAAFEQNLA